MLMEREVKRLLFDSCSVDVVSVGFLIKCVQKDLEAADILYSIDQHR